MAFKTVNAQEFERTLQQALPQGKFVLLDVYADKGCNTCTKLDALAAIEHVYASAWHLLRLDADAPDSAQFLSRYRITGLPTLALFKPDDEHRMFIHVPDDDGKNVLEWLEAEATP